MVFLSFFFFCCTLTSAKLVCHSPFFKKKNTKQKHPLCKLFGHCVLQSRKDTVRDISKHVSGLCYSNLRNIFPSCNTTRLPIVLELPILDRCQILKYKMDTPLNLKLVPDECRDPKKPGLLIFAYQTRSYHYMHSSSEIQFSTVFVQSNLGICLVSKKRSQGHLETLHILRC